MSTSNARSTRNYCRFWLSTAIRLQQFCWSDITKRFAAIVLAAFILTAFASSTVFGFTRPVRPKTIVISLDGATPTLVNKYLTNGAGKNKGLGLLENRGTVATQNITINPSLTAPSHIAIATGSVAAANNINANSFHLVASLFNQNISGFAAPIGGYSIDGPMESSQPTANPLWLALRANGKKVVAATFPGADGVELEAIYTDRVRTFVDYQTRVALRAIARNSNSDLVLTYIEQPDGSSHQFLLTDPRQATDFKNLNTIGQGQDRAKIERYQNYVQTSYYVANQAVQRIINAVGNRRGRPRSNIIVVSDRGFAPFHTAVNLNNFLASRGFDNTKVRAITSGSAVNVYFNLQGREPNGTVSRSEYTTLQQQVVQALSQLVDTNLTYTLGSQSVPVFAKIYARPVSTDLEDPLFGLRSNDVIGQDAGDVFATISLGYNFDGTQNPVVQCLGDASSDAPIFSVPNFYGAHGYDPELPEMSAIFYAAGPNINRQTIPSVRNIDIAPTILQLLGVNPADTVQGKPINLTGG